MLDRILPLETAAERAGRGGGTDVSPYSDKYGGYILNVTLDMFAYATIQTRDDGKVFFNAQDIS